MPEAAGSTQPIEILQVEDNEADVLLTRMAFEECDIPIRLHWAENGDRAMQFLRRAGAVRPKLILLDLNLPGRSGTEVLNAIKADPELKNIPVIILSSSRAEEDLRRAYGAYANCYLTKPMRLEDFVEMIRSMREFWFERATLPPV